MYLYLWLNARAKEQIPQPKSSFIVRRTRKRSVKKLCGLYAGTRSYFGVAAFAFFYCSIFTLVHLLSASRDILSKQLTEQLTRQLTKDDGPKSTNLFFCLFSPFTIHVTSSRQNDLLLRHFVVHPPRENIDFEISNTLKLTKKKKKTEQCFLPHVCLCRTNPVTTILWQNGFEAAVTAAAAAPPRPAPAVRFR